jgi:hypothetical protein
MRYPYVIWSVGITGGFLYALSYFWPEVHAVVVKYLPRPAPLGIAALFAMGVALGSSVACALAPPAFLGSEEGVCWLEGYGRTRKPWVFRAKALVIAGVVVIATVDILLYAFVFV